MNTYSFYIDDILIDHIDSIRRLFIDKNGKHMARGIVVNAILGYLLENSFDYSLGILRSNPNFFEGVIKNSGSDNKITS